MGVLGGGRGGRPPSPRLEKFQGKLCFEGKRKLPQKNVVAFVFHIFIFFGLFFRASLWKFGQKSFVP